ncbi:MAG: thioredoxin domain-containing protein [Thermoanaerobaculales bacterium]|jgi:hypothetical protein|nr:thioredoxin domain-containing protein [Thermoanaerobaculales bacterium]
MSHPPDTGSPPRANRLAGEKSPYLLQHAGNPVDWYPWGEEAFEKAREEDRPIFLSIGYATCHWCHVMEHESFEDPIVAALMNETFVNVKVDREERPDIDQVYMTVCQMLTGSGGWPLTIVMTPDTKPFFAATYLPRESRFGRIGMLDLIPRVGQLWRNERDPILASAEQITARLGEIAEPRAAADPDPTLPDRAYRELEARFDRTHGGFGGAPKFPSSHNLIFLSRYARLAGQPRALEMAERTLEAMHRGGIFDQIGFGLHRYSTDAEWLVPHFEKMLYDQAMLVLAATEAHLAGGRSAAHRRIVDEVATYVRRDMTSPDGAFFSAEDADSEGEEGRFYVWTADEVARVVGPEDAALVGAIWNLTPEGNFADEASGRRTGANIPHRTELGDAAAARLGGTPEHRHDRLAETRSRLFSYRVTRVHPLKDDKVLADWNGLMIAALARAGRVFDEPSYVEAARRSLAFVLGSMRDRRGRLHHRWRAGELAVPAFLDDHAFLAWGAIELYDSTLDPAFLELALDLQAETDRLFWDSAHGGYFSAAADSEVLLVRQKEVYDGAIPSGNSVAAMNLVRLARLSGRADLSDRAARLFAAFAADTARSASAHGHLADAFQLACAPSLEVVVVGDPDADDTRAMLEVIRSAYRPQGAVLLVPPGSEGDRVRELAPFTAGHRSADGRATAFACRDFACGVPTTDPEALRRMLEGA